MNPLLIKWMISALHGPEKEGFVFALNGIGFAGWVGVFITAMNLIPIGQLDGGHILYTLIGRGAHVVAILIIATGIALMIGTGTYSYGILLILLMLTGARHPPTSNDQMPLGIVRQVIGWVTMSFLIIGFTPQPIIIQEGQTPAMPQQNQNRRADPREARPDSWVRIESSVGVKRVAVHSGEEDLVNSRIAAIGRNAGLQPSQISHHSAL